MFLYVDTAFRSFAVDYASLPFLDPVPMSTPLPDSSFAIAKEGDRYSLLMTDSLVTEVQIGDYRITRGVNGAVPVERTPARGAEAICGHGAASSAATWQGYAREGSSPDEMTFVCYEGRFDGRSCTAVARSAWRVTARRLADGGVFGFRSIGGACRADRGGTSPSASAGHEERLDVIGPRATWIGSSDPKSIDGAAMRAPFTHLSIPVERGGSSSAVLDVGASDLLSAIQNAPEGAAELSYSFEIIWPSAASAPSATAFVSLLRGNPSQWAPARSAQSTAYD